MKETGPVRIIESCVNPDTISNAINKGAHGLNVPHFESFTTYKGWVVFGATTTLLHYSLLY